MTTEQQQLPDKGILQIDGKPVTSLAYQRHINQDTGCTYDVTASFGGKRVLQLKGLTMVELDEAIGHKNADTMHRRTDGVDKDTLKGDKLHFHNGTTEAGKAERAQQADKAKAAEQAADLGKSPEAEALAKRMGITAAELQRRLQQHDEEQAAHDKRATGTVKRIDVPQQEPQVPAEKRQELEEQRAKLRAEVEKGYLVRDGRYYAKDRENALAIEDRGHKLVTADKTANVAVNMAKLAEAKGWDSIKVSGDPNFKREVWIEATTRGIAVKGYTPKEADIAALEARQRSRATNEVAKDAPAKPDPAKARAEAADKAQGDIAKAKRKERSDEDGRVRQHEADAKQKAPARTERLNTVEAVAKAVTLAKVRNPETQKLVQQEVATRLDKMHAKGIEPPAPRVYDKQAASKQRGPELPRQQIERNTERTR